MGMIVLAQIPSAKDVLGVLLVMMGVAVHKPAPSATSAQKTHAHSPARDGDLCPSLRPHNTGALAVSGGPGVGDERK
jgi:hypothetical protein